MSSQEFHEINRKNPAEYTTNRCFWCLAENKKFLKSEWHVFSWIRFFVLSPHPKRNFLTRHQEKSQKTYFRFSISTIFLIYSSHCLPFFLFATFSISPPSKAFSNKLYALMHFLNLIHFSIFCYTIFEYSKDWFWLFRISASIVILSFLDKKHFVFYLPNFPWFPFHMYFFYVILAHNFV